MARRSVAINSIRMFLVKKQRTYKMQVGELRIGDPEVANPGMNGENKLSI